MVEDEELKRAVSRILQRSERQDDLQKLLGTFVDVGILPQLENNNNQIFYGRRGTGKTHVLRVLGSKLSDNPANTVVYIDARTLGSTAQFSDPSVPLSVRCLTLFKDILTETHNALLEHIVEHPPHNANLALAAADELLSVIVEPSERVETEALEIKGATNAGTSGGAKVLLSTSSAGLEASTSSQSSERTELTGRFRVHHNDKVIFPGLHRQLTSVLDLAQTTLFILFDEWSSLPSDVQPYLAEFLRRGVLPVRRAVLKIASLEYRSHFSILGGKTVGFELGADISVTQDLDDYYVFDRNPDQITEAYADMIFRHLASELPEGYLLKTHGVSSGSELASRLFTERATCAELARASEGVARDLINIFTSAYFYAVRRGRTSIDRKAIVEAARQWFEQDKARFLDDELQGVLRRIVDDVIGNRRARSFLLPRELENHPIVRRLFDARVLHQMQRGYADKDNPGVRYNIYTLDYGTYVDLLGTTKQPDMSFLQEGSEPNLVVPFDDKRSIRRIILDRRVLEPNATGGA